MWQKTSAPNIGATLEKNFPQSTSEKQIYFSLEWILHSCEHSHSESRKQGFLSKSRFLSKIQHWLRNAEVTEPQMPRIQTLTTNPDKAGRVSVRAFPKVQDHDSLLLLLFFPKMWWHPAKSSSIRAAETRETDHIFQACFVSRLSAFSQQSSGYHRFW